MQSHPQAYGNMWRASVANLGGAVLAKDERKLYLTSCPTRSEWFERFMRGNKSRTGIMRRRNFGVSVETIKRFFEVLEEDWVSSRYEGTRQEIEDVALFVLLEYCGGLCGEEVPLLELSGVLRFWNETHRHRIPHVMVTLKGRFKGEAGDRWHLLPLADHTRTGLPVRPWFCRVVHQRVNVQGKRKGWVFAREDGTRGKFGDYHELF